jgi:cation:H+ antiporter
LCKFSIRTLTNQFKGVFLILLLDIVLVIFSILMLWKGADWLVEAAAEIAHSLKISDLVIGLTVVAFGTSAPEFAVTIKAALTGQTDISIGNVVGSNIFNLGFILGGTAMIRTITITPKLLYRDGLFLLFVTILIYALFFIFNASDGGNTFTALEGSGLFIALIGYIIFLFVKKEPMEETHPASADLKSYLWFFVGLISIVLGGHLMVEHASSLASAFGVSDWVIAVTIVAAGTSAPELATSLTAAFKNKHGMAIGNLIGSDLFNLLGVLGLAGIINPTNIQSDIHSSIVVLIIMVAMVLVMMRTNWQISRLQGTILVSLNLVRWYLDFSG